MQEFVYSTLIKKNCPETHHFITCRIRIKNHTHRMLHPGIGDKDPECGETSSNSHKPGGKKVKSFTYFIPSKKHYSNKSRFQEKSHNPFNRQRSTEYIAHKP